MHVKFSLELREGRKGKRSRWHCWCTYHGYQPVLVPEIAQDAIHGEMVSILFFLLPQVYGADRTYRYLVT